MTRTRCGKRRKCCCCRHWTRWDKRSSCGIIDGWARRADGSGLDCAAAIVERIGGSWSMVMGMVWSSSSLVGAWPRSERRRSIFSHIYMQTDIFSYAQLATIARRAATTTSVTIWRRRFDQFVYYALGLAVDTWGITGFFTFVVINCRWHIVILVMMATVLCTILCGATGRRWWR